MALFKKGGAQKKVLTTLQEPLEDGGVDESGLLHAHAEVSQLLGWNVRGEQLEVALISLNNVLLQTIWVKIKYVWASKEQFVQIVIVSTVSNQL